MELRRRRQNFDVVVGGIDGTLFVRRLVRRRRQRLSDARGTDDGDDLDVVVGIVLDLGFFRQRFGGNGRKLSLVVDLLSRCRRSRFRRRLCRRWIRFLKADDLGEDAVAFNLRTWWTDQGRSRFGRQLCWCRYGLLIFNRFGSSDHDILRQGPGRMICSRLLLSCSHLHTLDCLLSRSRCCGKLWCRSSRFENRFRRRKLRWLGDRRRS